MNNAYQFLRKLSAEEVRQLERETDFSSQSTLPGGYLTDGMGGIYGVPEKGQTTMFTTPGTPDNIRFKYDFDKKTLDVYSRLDKSSPERELLTSYPLSVENFVDGPEYWARTAYAQVQDEVEREAEMIAMAEAIDFQQKQWEDEFGG